MFDEYRNRMERMGNNIRNANRHSSTRIMERTFMDSQNACRVIMNGKKYDARVITDSNTTVRGGNGNHIIQFRDGVNPIAGTYVQIPDVAGKYEYWMIMYKSDEHVNPKHIIKKCNYLLKWKNHKGEVVHRWCVISDNVRLMDGERKTNYNKLAISYYNTTLAVPMDDETINIGIDKRFLIDHPNVTGNPDAWIVTNKNIISKHFGDIDEYDGIIELAVSRHQFNHNVDSKEFMIADYYEDYLVPEDVRVTEEYFCRILYSGLPILRMGTPFKNFSAEVYHNGVLDEEAELNWEVVITDAFTDKFTYIVDGNELKIKCEQDSLMKNSHIKIIVSNDEYGINEELLVKVVGTL